jgi:transposase
MMEATGPAMEIARILEPHVGRWWSPTPRTCGLSLTPGVGASVAVTLMAAIGDISRFSSPRQLVAYLGLDPKVRQSGDEQTVARTHAKRSTYLTFIRNIGLWQLR